MDPDLRDLLKTTAVETGGDNYSVMSLYGPRGKWKINNASLTNFWTSYCKMVTEKHSVEENVNLCLAEKPQEVMPQVAKFTFKFQVENSKEEEEKGWVSYSDDLLMWLCFIYQNVIYENFQLQGDNMMELVCVILESNTHWYEDCKEEKSRYAFLEVVLHFPYSKIDASLQNKIIRPKVIQLLRKYNVLSKMGRQPVGDWEQIISYDTVNTPLVMFGSSDKPGKSKLDMTHIWSFIDMEMLEAKTIPDEITLEDTFIPINHIHIQQHIVGTDIFDEDVPLEHWLPMFLSIGYWPAVLLPKSDVSNVTPQSQPKVFGMGSKSNADQTENDLDLAETLLSMISLEKIIFEPTWLDIGKALHTSDQGGENGLMTWIRFTEKMTANVNPLPIFMTTAGTINQTCRSLYDIFTGNSISVKTLAWYAKEDMPDKYNTWHRDWCQASLEQATTCTHTDVANAFHKCYWLDYVFCPVGKGRWFQFKSHRWVEIYHGLSIKKIVSSDFMKKFEAARVSLSRSIHDSNDDVIKSNGEMMMKKLSQVIAKLKTVPFKASVLTEFCEHFFMDKFVTLLDSNSDLLGVTNGVLEVVGTNVFFRKAKPEDYISMCCNNPYNGDYSWGHPLVKECMHWISQVFTDKKLNHHFLKFASSLLRGGNNEKLFPVFTGDGDNSKSMIVKLFEAVFNSYCIKFPVELLTEKGMSSSGPTPQLARAKATHVAFLDEPEDDVPMKKGTIKRYTGGDSFFARLLQDNGGDIKATFTMILMCNKVPIIPHADRAIRNRTRLFPFLSSWVDDPPESEEEQFNQRRFKKDPFFERRIPILAPAFLWILVKYYPHYATEGLIDPPIIKETTETYWKENDTYASFVADCIKDAVDADGKCDMTAKVTLSEVYTEFKAWFRDAFPGIKVPERTIVRAELTSRWGKLYGPFWYGIRIAKEGEVISATDMLKSGIKAANLGGKDKNNKPVPEKISPSYKLNIISKGMEGKQEVDTSKSPRTPGGSRSSTIKSPTKKDFYEANETKV